MTVCCDCVRCAVNADGRTFGIGVSKLGQPDTPGTGCTATAVYSNATITNVTFGDVWHCSGYADDRHIFFSFGRIWGFGGALFPSSPFFRFLFCLRWAVAFGHLQLVCHTVVSPSAFDLWGRSVRRAPCGTRLAGCRSNMNHRSRSKMWSKMWFLLLWPHAVTVCGCAVAVLWL